MELNQSHLNFVANVSQTDDPVHLCELFAQHLKDNGLSAYVHGFSCYDSDAAHNPQAIFMHSTLPQELMDVYFETGGLSNDPIAASLFKSAGPILVAMADLPNDISEHSQNPFVQCCVDYKFDAAISVPLIARNGAGNMFIWAAGETYSDRKKNARTALTNGTQYAVRLFHDSIFKGKYVADSFQLTPKELEALKMLTKGSTSSEMADQLNISERAVEKRLSSVRKKIGATNSVNAVYRAAILNII